MRSFPRRGLASFAIASVLVFAPLASTAAFADDEPIVETVVESPVVEEPVVETPVIETPEADAPGVEIVEASADDSEPSESEVIEIAAVTEDASDADNESAATAPVASRLASAPQSLAASYTCDVASGNYFRFCIDLSGTTATVFWEPTPYGASNPYTYGFYDFSGVGWITPGYVDTTALSAQFTVTPGHEYYVYVGDYWNGQSLQFTFQAGGAPTAPTSLAADRLATSDGFALSWLAAAATGFNAVDSYTIDATSTSDGAVTSYSTADLSFELTGLVAGEEYTIAVTAIAEDGQTSSPATTTVTLEAIAPTAATGVVLSRSGETLSAAWTAPTYDGGIAPVEYWVELYADGDLVETDSQTGTSISFDETAEFSVEYTVVVTAYTDAGDAPTATSNAVTRADSTPGTPTPYTDAYGYKDARVHVSWDLAAATGSDVHTLTVTLYDAAGAEFDQQTFSLAGDRTSTDFTLLPNDTAFTVTIAATNNAGTSPESAPVAVTTLGLIPPSPTADDLTPASNYAGVTVGLTGTTLTAHINGLSAGDWVYGTAFSTPTGLGWTQVDAAGTATWSIAGANLPTGAHTLAVQNTFGATLGSAGFTIAAPATARAALAQAGTDPSSSMTVAIAMLALGVLVTATRLRRRARA